MRGFELSAGMLEVVLAKPFAAWLAGLRDTKARRIIGQRLARLELGLIGDAKPVGPGVSELRIDFGPGYRLYFARRGACVIVMLGGGDKGSQSRDISRAIALAAELE